MSLGSPLKSMLAGSPRSGSLFSSPAAEPMPLRWQAGTGIGLPWRRREASMVYRKLTLLDAGVLAGVALVCRVWSSLRRLVALTAADSGPCRGVPRLVAWRTVGGLVVVTTPSSPSGALGPL